jgi:hypothetical protein
MERNSPARPPQETDLVGLSTSMSSWNGNPPNSTLDVRTEAHTRYELKVVPDVPRTRKRIRHQRARDSISMEGMERI